MIDRRLLPGEEPEVASSQLHAHLADALDFDVAVSAEAQMLPAQVPADSAVVTALLRHLEAVGRPAQTMVSRNTFDAGYACARGIPTVMFGPGRRSFGSDVVTDEVVALDDCWDAARALAGLISDWCEPEAVPET